MSPKLSGSVIELQLENLVDNSSVEQVLNSLAEVCYAKADHILENWQDDKMAEDWRREPDHAGRVGGCLWEGGSARRAGRWKNAGRTRAGHADFESGMGLGAGSEVFVMSQPKRTPIAELTESLGEMLGLVQVLRGERALADSQAQTQIKAVEVLNRARAAVASIEGKAGL